MSSDVIVTASEDNTLKVWEENSSGKQWNSIHTLTAHTNNVIGEDHTFFVSLFQTL